MDPENVAMRTRLAEVYVRLNKKTEAWQLFAAAADSLRARGQLGPAEEILNRMLTLDPSNSHALLLRGRNAFDSGDMAAAIQNLEKVADLDSHPDGLRALMQAYLQGGRLPEAGTLAAKLCTVHNDTGAITGYADALMAAGQPAEVLKVYQQYCDRLVATDSGKVLESLHALIGHMREDAPALEILLDLSQKAGDTTHITELYELLAHASVQAGNLDKARDYYLKLTQMEPQNQLHTRNYEQVLAKLGGAVSGSRLITPEEGAVLVEELEATAPFIDQRYADDIALAVRAALTDAELFVSYNMPAKALGPLMSALPKAPRSANQPASGRVAYPRRPVRRGRRLLPQPGTALSRCRTSDEASRYSDLAGKYEERTSTKPVVASDATAPGQCRLLRRSVPRRPAPRLPLIILPLPTWPRLRLQSPNLRRRAYFFTHRHPRRCLSPASLRCVPNRRRRRVKLISRPNGKRRSRMNRKQLRSRRKLRFQTWRPIRPGRDYRRNHRRASLLPRALNG